MHGVLQLFSLTRIAHECTSLMERYHPFWQIPLSPRVVYTSYIVPELCGSFHEQRQRLLCSWLFFLAVNTPHSKTFLKRRIY
jgi:hypothetical protein